jgi:hypothetical protein
VDDSGDLVLHWCHVFDHRGDRHAHGFHVLWRHAVLLLRLTPARTSPALHLSERPTPPETNP